MISAKRLLVYSIVLSNFMYSCSVPLTNVEPSVKQNFGLYGNNLEFKKVSVDKSEQYGKVLENGINAASPATPPTAAPSPAATTAPSSQTPSGPNSTGSASDIATDPVYAQVPSAAYNYYTPAPYYQGNYSNPGFGGYPFSFWGSFEEYVPSELEEARKPGFTGSYNQAMKEVVNPVMQALANDTRIVSIIGNTDGSGNVPKTGDVTPPSPYNSGTYNWQFTMVSNSKKEVYGILVTEVETVILRQKWVAKDLKAEDTIDSTEALEIVKKAVKNKDFKIEQPDYPSPYYSYAPTAQPYYPYGADEQLYEIPEDSSLSYSFEKNGNDAYWNLSFHYYDNNSSSEYYYNSGFAKVNAMTGKIVALNRMYRFRNYPTPAPYPYTPSPYPEYTPTPTPSATPTAVSTSYPVSMH